MKCARYICGFVRLNVRYIASPAFEATNPYDLLGVDRNINKVDLRAHFRELSKTYHPDQGGDAEQFKRIYQAYTLIMKRVERRESLHPDDDTTSSASHEQPKREKPRSPFKKHEGAGSWSKFASKRAAAGRRGSGAWDTDDWEFYKQFLHDYNKQYGGDPPHMAFKNWAMHRYMFGGPFPGDDPKFFLGNDWKGSHCARTLKLGNDFRKYKAFTFIKKFHTIHFDVHDYQRWAQDVFCNHAEFEKFMRHTMWFEQFPHFYFGTWENEVMAQMISFRNSTGKRGVRWSDGTNMSGTSKGSRNVWQD